VARLAEIVRADQLVIDLVGVDLPFALRPWAAQQATAASFAESRH
jgi:hypothetical protein